MTAVIGRGGYKKPRTKRSFRKQKHDELTGSYRPIADIRGAKRNPPKWVHAIPLTKEANRFYESSVMTNPDSTERQLLWIMGYLGHAGRTCARALVFARR